MSQCKKFFYEGYSRLTYLILLVVSDVKMELVNIHYLIYQKYDIHSKLDNIIIHY